MVSFVHLCVSFQHAKSSRLNGENRLLLSLFMLILIRILYDPYYFFPIGDTDVFCSLFFKN